MLCCRGCFGKTDPTGDNLKGRRTSFYGIVNELDAKDDKMRNALSVKLQMEMTEELTESTYGLSPEGASGPNFEAQDFFSFKEILGSGATGVVFRAIFKPTNQTFAVKFIPNFRQSKILVIRELTVLKLSSECRHLIGYHSHFRVSSNMYFVMELCEGGTLMDLLEPKHSMPPKLARVYLKELALAIFFLHKLRIVHRDIYLANCVLTSRAHLKLIDFGLCRTIDEPQGEIMTDCGKPAVRAPEIYLDRPCGLAIDWWSFGVMLYRFITGYNPFRTDKLTEGYQSVTKLKEKYPEWLFDDPHAKDLCQKLLVKDPRLRIGSENEVIEIKSHPYFKSMDWDDEDDITQLLDLDGQGEIDRYFVVIARVCNILHIPTDHLASTVNKARGSIISLEHNDKNRLISAALKKMLPSYPRPRAGYVDGKWIHSLSEDFATESVSHERKIRQVIHMCRPRIILAADGPSSPPS